MAEEKEPICFKKAVSGIVEPRNYIKAGVFSMNIGIVVLLVIGAISVFNFFFGKNGNNTQKQKLTSTINVEQGANVGALYVGQDQKQEINKKTVGLEASVSSVDAGLTFKKYLNDNMYVGAGARWAFESDNDKMAITPEIKAGWDF